LANLLFDSHEAAMTLVLDIIDVLNQL